MNRVFIFTIPIVFAFYVNCIHSAHAESNPPDARVAAINARLVKVDASKDAILKGLRTKLDEIERIKDDLEKKDANCRRIRQRLRELGAETESLKQELEKRLASVSRYSESSAAYAKSMDDLQSLREEERQLLIEKRVLECKISQP